MIRRRRGVAEAEREGARRMRQLLELGEWPTGLPLSSEDRRVIEHNIAHVERRFGRADR